MAIFYSQLDSRWADEEMGNCGIKIRDYGCAVAATAMLLTSYGVTVDPKTLNESLGANGGYTSDCLIRWDVAANFDPSKNIRFLHHNTLTSPEAIRDGLQQGKRVIVASTRFVPQTHFVWIRSFEPGNQLDWSNFIYWDPADLQKSERRVGDGWVDGGAGTRVFL